MKRVFFTALLLFSNGPAYAEWVSAAQTSEATIYVDFESIRSKEGLVEVWVIFDYKRMQRLSDESHYLSVKRLHQYQCASEWSRLLASTFFLGNMGKGHVVDDSVKEDKWRLVPPAGVGRTIMDIACKSKQ